MLSSIATARPTGAPGPPYLAVVATMGKRDLQFLVVDDRGQRLRVSPHPDRVGALHRALGKDVAYVVWCPEGPNDAVAELRSGWVDWDGGELRLKVPDHQESAGLRIAHESDLGSAAPGTQRPARVVLVPGLLYQLLARLRRELESGTYRLAGVLLLDTNRGEASDRAAEEPVAAAPIIQEWLRKWLTHVPGFDPKLIRTVTYLLQGDQLNEEDSLGNRFLNSHAAERIERAVADLARGYTGASVRLHDAGGIPGVLPILHEAARFWFAAVEPVSPDEDVRRPRARVAKDPPAALLEGRRRARDLIQHGEFTAAEVAVAGLHSTPAWRLAVEAAGRFFACDTDQMLSRASLAGGAVQKRFSELDLSNTSLPNCLRVALRGEAALWAGEVVQAAMLTVTFYEVALLDGVSQTFTRSGSPSCVDWESGSIQFGRATLTNRELRRVADGFANSWPHADVYSDPPAADQVARWLGRAQYFIKLTQGWHDLAAIEAIRSRNGNLAATLEGCWRQLYKPNKSGMFPAQFRNVFAHVVPNQQLVERAKQSFTGRGFWNEGDSRSGRRFLATTLHEPILKALGVPDPASCYAHLVAELVAELEKPASAGIAS